MSSYRNRDEYLSEYQKYLARISMSVLKCRNHSHNLPDWDEITKGSKWVTIYRTLGGYMVVLICKRRCGTTVTRFYTSDGVIARSPRITHDEYEYPERGYLIPKEARSGHGLTKEMRAMARAEEFERLTEWITEQ